MGWFGFWIFMAVFVAVDGWLYSQGIEDYIFLRESSSETVIQDDQHGLCLEQQP